MAVICLPLDDPDTVWDDYCPTLAPAIVFSVLYGLTTLVHIFQAFQHKKAFCWVLIMGAAWETGQAICRSIAVVYPTIEPVYQAHFMLIVLATLWINAFDYILLSRIVQYCYPSKRLFGMKAQKLGSMFVWLDIIAFIIQFVGAIMTSNDEDDMVKIGLHIYTGGMAVQASFILGFLVLCVSVHRRLPKLVELGQLESSRAASCLLLLRLIYISLGLILLRLAFRLIEFSSGVGTALTEHLESREWYLYVFDMLPMLGTLILFNIWHPGTMLIGPDSDFPKEEKRSRAQKRADEQQRRAMQSTAYQNNEGGNWSGWAQSSVAGGNLDNGSGHNPQIVRSDYDGASFLKSTYSGETTVSRWRT